MINKNELKEWVKEKMTNTGVVDKPICKGSKNYNRYFIDGEYPLMESRYIETSYKYGTKMEITVGWDFIVEFYTKFHENQLHTEKKNGVFYREVLNAYNEIYDTNIEYKPVNAGCTNYKHRYNPPKPWV